MTQLHPITPQLVAEYKAVRLRALKDTPLAFGSTYERESQFTEDEWNARAANLDGNKAVGYLATSNKDYAGLAVCFLDESDGTVAYLYSMWVAPEQRRSGVGKELVLAIERWAAEHGARTLQLMVTNINHPASTFYERLGFAKTGRTEPYPNDPALFEYEMLKLVEP
jgi:ribosomal protein S18 acetylase RimI-like enzyme